MTKILSAAAAFAAALLPVLATGAEAPVPAGATLLRRIEWDSVTLPPSVRLAPDSTGGNFIIITKRDNDPAEAPLWTSTDPGIHTRCYALRGKVRYLGVVGVGYFNLWNEFQSPEAGSAKASYFTRTLADDGPMMKVTGSSNWRPIIIPFDASASKVPLKRLELDFVFAGPGEVNLTDLDLLEFAGPAEMWAALGSGVPPAAAISTSTTANPAASQPSIWSTIEVIAVAGILFLAALATMFWRRRQAEFRRMRAMDAK
jgi:hypothetical protein